jgi:predicted AlkP superfamily phosphohydrolase/phosphomutase
LVQEQVFRQGGGWLANRMESNARFSGLDWAGSRAFSEESNTCPAIWLNLAGRDPAGVVPPADYETLRAEIIAKLEAWRDPDSRLPVVARAWPREALYHGPYVEEAPDIVLELALDGGYAYTCQSSRGTPGRAGRRLTPAEYLGAKGQSMNGSHRADGILMVAGPGVRAGQQIIGATLMDIAPTVLALLQQTPPYPLDGRPLAEALVTSPGEQPQSPDGEEPWQPGPIQAYSPEEAKLVAERLHNLGYLE